MPTIPVTSTIRRHSGEHHRHVHDHAQGLFALSDSMELGVAGRTLFADASTGLVIPAGLEHGDMAPREVRMLVIDARGEGAGVAARVARRPDESLSTIRATRRASMAA